MSRLHLFVGPIGDVQGANRIQSRDHDPPITVSEITAAIRWETIRDRDLTAERLNLARTLHVVLETHIVWWRHLSQYDVWLGKPHELDHLVE